MKTQSYVIKQEVNGTTTIPAPPMRQFSRQLSSGFASHDPPDVTLSITENTDKPAVHLRYLQLVNFCVAVLSSTACISLLAPFFPGEASKKGLDESQASSPFTAYYVVFGLVGPLSSRLSKYVPHTAQVAIGFSIAGLTTIVIGLSQYVPGVTPFMALVVGNRMVEAVGGTLAIAASPALMIALFPERLASIMSLYQSMVCIGVAIGPGIGGILFHYGGFGLPFYFFGVVQILNGCLCGLAQKCIAGSIQKEEANTESSVSLSKILADGYFILDIVLFIVAFVLQTFNFPTLADHLVQFNLTSIENSLVFVVNPAVMLLCAPFYGRILDNLQNPKWMTLFCLGACLTSTLLIGPANFFPVETKLWMVIVALAVQGAGVPGVTLACYVHALQNAVDRGFPNNKTTVSTVTGIRNFTVAVAGIIGSLLGGPAVSYLGYRPAQSYLSLGVLIMISLCVISMVLERRANKKIDRPNVQLTAFRVDSAFAIM